MHEDAGSLVRARLGDEGQAGGQRAEQVGALAVLDIDMLVVGDGVRQLAGRRRAHAEDAHDAYRISSVTWRAAPSHGGLSVPHARRSAQGCLYSAKDKHKLGMGYHCA